MFKWIWMSSLLIPFLIQESKANDLVGYTYLGKTSRSSYCYDRAKRQGYDVFRYGGDVDGYFRRDACFGKKKKHQQNRDQVYFDIDIEYNYSRGYCMKKIEREAQDIECQRGFRSKQIFCSGNSKNHYIKSEISRVRCVRNIWNLSDHLFKKY